jgi:hypothetical protein
MKRELLLLKALKERCNQFKNTTNGRHSISEFQKYEKQFKGILKKLDTEGIDLFNDFDPSDYRENARIGSYDLKAVNALADDIQYCIDIISGYEEISDSKVEITMEGIFIAGKTFDALLKISNLISEAKKVIILIDGYVNEDILKMLTSKGEDVEVKILTKNQSLEKLKSFIEAFNKQYKRLEVKSSEKYHDRFLIIDNKDFYHFGASLKDAGQRTFMFSKIEDEIIIQELMKNFQIEWKA